MSDLPKKFSLIFHQWNWLLDNPVIIKELRSRMRGNRAFIVLTLYLLVLSFIVSMVYLVFVSSAQVNGSISNRQLFGKVMFGVVVSMQLVTVSFIAPALTAAAISSEREHQSYDLLRTTLLSAKALVLGKFLSALLYVLLLLFTALPLMSLAFLFGGVAPAEVVIASIMLAVTAITFCSVGIFFSSFIPRSLVSTVLAYAFSIILVFGLPMVILLMLGLFNVPLMGISRLPSAFVENFVILFAWFLVSINPLATAVATEMILIEQQGVFLFTLPRLTSGTITLISPWIPYSIFFLMISLFLLVLSIQLVRRVEN